MPFEPFAMERWQSTWEHRVRYNLSESGVHPLSARELLALSGGESDGVLDLALGYSQSNGTERLRASVAALYPGADLDQVLVTSGSAEANFLVCWRLIEPGDRVAVMLPNYMQTAGLARAFGAEVRPFHLVEAAGWLPDLAEIEAAVAPGTKLIIVTNPNNPTGALLSEEAMDHVVTLAERAGAWILADEVYHGAERDGTPTPSFWGRSERVIVTNGLSKAYGLPGLRIGWCVGPRELIAELWARHDYTTISPSGPSDLLAAIALEPAVRSRVLERTRRIIGENWPVLEGWLRAQDGRFSYIPPRAGAICLARYRAAVGSSEIAERLRRDHSVLVVPGDHFGMDRFIRFGFGLPRADLEAALARVGEAFRELW